MPQYIFPHRGHMLRAFLITGQHVIHTVYISFVCLLVRNYLGLVDKAAYPTIVVPDLSITVGICPLVLVYFYRVYSNTIDIFLCWNISSVRYGQSRGIFFLELFWCLTHCKMFKLLCPISSGVSTARALGFWRSLACPLVPCDDRCYKHFEYDRLLLQAMS